MLAPRLAGGGRRSVGPADSAVADGNYKQLTRTNGSIASPNFQNKAHCPIASLPTTARACHGIGRDPRLLQAGSIEIEPRVAGQVACLFVGRFKRLLDRRD